LTENTKGHWFSTAIFSDRRFIGHKAKVATNYHIKAILLSNTVHKNLLLRPIEGAASQSSFKTSFLFLYLLLSHASLPMKT